MTTKLASWSLAQNEDGTWGPAHLDMLDALRLALPSPPQPPASPLVPIARRAFMAALATAPVAPLGYEPVTWPKGVTWETGLLVSNLGQSDIAMTMSFDLAKEAGGINPHDLKVITEALRALNDRE